MCAGFKAPDGKYLNNHMREVSIILSPHSNIYAMYNKVGTGTDNHAHNCSTAVNSFGSGI